MFVLTVVLGFLVAMAFAGMGVGMVMAHPMMDDTRERLGVSRSLWTTIGVLHLLGAAGLIVGLWIEGIGIAAAVGLTLLTAGAVAAHVKAKDSVQLMMPAIMMLTLSVLYLIFRAATT